MSILDRKPRLGGQVMLNMAKLIGQRLIHANMELEKLDSQMSENSNQKLRKKIWQDK